MSEYPIVLMPAMLLAYAEYGILNISNEEMALPHSPGKRRMGRWRRRKRRKMHAILSILYLATA
ncbi:MAG: hypothetical protein PW843_03520 [Azospirillaceae bacterium]|nr:hypothetical protein [Azospirillaceae bacterium]